MRFHPVVVDRVQRLPLHDTAYWWSATVLRNLYVAMRIAGRTSATSAYDEHTTYQTV